MSKLIICWEEIVFEFRNKDYGAYLLRYTYPYYLAFSALIVILVFLSGMIGPKLFKEEQVQETETKAVRVLNYTELAPPPPIKRVYVPPPPSQVVVQEKMVQKYVAPVVTTKEVAETQEIITIKEVKENVNSSSDTKSTIGGSPVVVYAPPAPAPVPAQVIVPAPNPEPEIIKKDPEFPGGKKALLNWLKEHLSYPPMAVRMGIEGEVRVTFNVDVKGKISDVTVVKSLHKLCDNEAVRLIKAMPEWIPGEEKGVKSNATYTVPIRFVLK